MAEVLAMRRACTHLSTRHAPLSSWGALAYRVPYNWSASTHALGSWEGPIAALAVSRCAVPQTARCICAGRDSPLPTTARVGALSPNSNISSNIKRQTRIS